MLRFFTERGIDINDRKSEKEAYRYWAFISYSSNDSAWGKWLHAARETYRIPRRLVGEQMPTEEPAPRRFNPIFRDRDELPAASDVGPEITSALTASRYLIVVCSPNCAKSIWVNREIEIFRALGREKRIFALIVDGKPNSQSSTECFPKELLKFQPLAADARPTADGKADAKLKLLSGMLGVGLDTLKLRDAKRRMLRLEIASGAILIVAGTVISLGWLSYKASQSAFSEGLRADALSLAPTEMVEYLLFTLPNQLEPLGEAELIIESRQQAENYLRNNRSRQYGSQIFMGEIYRKQMLQGDKHFWSGEAEKALEAYQTARKILNWTDQFFSTVDYGVPIAENHVRVGKALEMLGRLEEALGEYRKNYVLLERINKKKRSGWSQGMDLRDAYRSIGDVLVKEGNFHEALEQYRKGFIVSQESVKPYSSDSGWSQIDVFGWHIRIGDTLQDSGALELARNEYSAALAIANGLIAQEKAQVDAFVRRLFKIESEARADSAWLSYLAIAHMRVGHNLARSGKLDESLSEYVAALHIFDSLAELDSIDHAPREKIADLYCYIGDVFLAQNKVEESLDEYRKALTIIDDFKDKKLNSSEWKYKLWAVKSAVANALIVQGRVREALAQSRKALDIAQAVTNQGGAGIEWHQALVKSHVQVADALTAEGDKNAGLAEYNTALRIALHVRSKYPDYASSKIQVLVIEKRIAKIFSPREALIN